MIGLDLKPETPPSGSSLIVEPQENLSEGKVSFSELLKSISVDKGILSLQSLSDDTIVDEENNSVTDFLTKNVKNSDEKQKSFSFDDLLKGVTEDKDAADNSTFITSLNNKKNELRNSKNNLLSVLSSEDSIEEIEFLDLNPEMQESFSKDELTMLIKDAKDYLKNQILSSEGFKRAEIETLPKTLKGLTQVAQKVGIDISKITIEEVRPNSDIDLSTNEEEIFPKQVNKNSHIKVNNLELHSKLSSVDNGSQQRVENNFEKKPMDSEKILQQPQVKKEIQSQPLFKAQSSPEISTQQIVNAKVSNNTKPLEVDKAKKRADDTLKLLLQGQKVTKQEGVNLTNDFSVATAKVLAPELKTDNTKSLEALLRPENITNDDTSETNSNSVKGDTLNVAKADSFEVKLNEAKQMIKYLSQDVKQAINDYKAPFTRVKVQLNPQQLGEIELTVVQRGKNLHVNLSSNNAAINTLAMNANDLKVQLQNNGINNASLNFSNNSQGGEAANGGQFNQQQQNRDQAQREYNYFETEEITEEIMNSLEIVVPNYA